VDTKYGYLVKKLDFKKNRSGSVVGFKGGDLAGLNMGFDRFYNSAEGGLIEPNCRHTHSYGQCLILAGLDYERPDSLGAEIEMVLGDEGEVYKINTPTLVIVPAELPHSPVATRNIKPSYGGFVVSLNGECHFTELPERSEKRSPGKKYAHLVKPLDYKDLHRKSGGNADFIASWNGKEFPNFDMNFTWAFHKGTGPWHARDPHVHPYDEILLFVGCDPDHPEYLGAEIEIGMGEELEKHVFDTSTVVVAPKNLVHCPIITRRVDKPYCFSAVCLNNVHETIWLGKDTGVGL
jgi:hypothetical protein